jgi:hypothetical protein
VEETPVNNTIDRQAMTATSKAQQGGKVQQCSVV